MAKQRERIEIRPGVFRSVTYTDNLMIAVIDFTNGPWDEPEPYHSHPHEQASYVAEGEVVLYCKGEPERRMKQGDVFAVSPDVPHTIRLLTQHARLVDSFTPIRQDFLQ